MCDPICQKSTVSSCLRFLVECNLYWNIPLRKTFLNISFFYHAIIFCHWSFDLSQISEIWGLLYKGFFCIDYDTLVLSCLQKRRYVRLRLSSEQKHHGKQTKGIRNVCGFSSQGNRFYYIIKPSVSKSGQTRGILKRVIGTKAPHCAATTVALCRQDECK